MAHTTTQRSWINPEKARYYKVFLDQDLLGDRTLIKVWGGISSNCGGFASSGVPSRNAGLEETERLSQRRSRRGYRRVASD